MHHFTPSHSDRGKCSILSVSSPHNTDLSTKSRRKITKGHPAPLIMIRGTRQSNTSAESPSHLIQLAMLLQSIYIPHVWVCKCPPPAWAHIRGSFTWNNSAADAVRTIALISPWTLQQSPTLSPAPVMESRAVSHFQEAYKFAPTNHTFSVHS